MTQALFADCLKVTFVVACGWWEEDGQVCVNIGKLSEREVITKLETYGWRECQVD